MAEAVFIKVRLYSYGKSGAGSYSCYGSGRIGVLKTGTAKARDKTKRFINTFYELLANMVQRAPGRPFFDAESEEDSHASDHVSIIDC